MTELPTPRVYVGTYAKYSAGSIAGQWLNLEDYTDKESFLAACAKLHQDEADPELMFQDFQGFPREYYAESSISEKLWDWLELDEADRELLAIYSDHIGDSDATIDQARDAFMGKGYNTKADWAAEWLEETGGLEGIPKHLENYIDFEAYARDAQLGGDVAFIRHDGELWVFSNH